MLGQAMYMRSCVVELHSDNRNDGIFDEIHMIWSVKIESFLFDMDFRLDIIIVFVVAQHRQPKSQYTANIID